MTAPRAAGPPPGLADVFRSWWPLAASWLLMGAELPLVSAVLARLPAPTVSLAAYGGVVFPLSMLIEGPIIMLLAASTALSRDANSYAVGRRFMWRAGLALTALHVALAFTPLYDVVVGRLLAPPPDVARAARTGLMLMTPWTMSIAYRRFQQGVLIRFGHSRVVGVGTAIRLGANALVLSAGMAWGRWPGIVIGPLGVALGVMAEAAYTGARVRPVRRGALAAAPPPAVALTMRRFLSFYLPLMMTPLILFLAMPLTSAALSRMPVALDSLAVWPVLTGLVFILRSPGFALNEVVVAMLDHPGAAAALRRFTLALGAATSGALLLLAATPLARAWFAGVAALPPALVGLALGSIALAVPVPAFSAAQSLFQGTLVHAHRTRAVTESVIVQLAVVAAVLFAGVAWGRLPGLPVGVAALLLGSGAQAGWLALAARAVPVGGAGAEAASRPDPELPIPRAVLRVEGGEET